MKGKQMTKTSEEILAIRSIIGLQELSWQDVARRDMTNKEIRHVLELTDALWLHSGDSNAPHAELTSGKCSDGFVDTLRMLRFTNLCELFAFKLLEKVRNSYKGTIDWVIGSDHAGADFSHSVATLISCKHDFTEKGPNKTQLWKRFTVESGERVLQVEELMTTANTLRAVRDGILRGNGTDPLLPLFAPVAAVLVHRSNLYEVDGTPIIYLVHYDINVWEPDECPLCKKGSKRLRPKENWVELTGK